MIGLSKIKYKAICVVALVLISLNAHAYRDKYDCKWLSIYIDVPHTCYGESKSKSITIIPDAEIKKDKATILLFSAVLQYKSRDMPLNQAAIYLDKWTYIEAKGSPINLTNTGDPKKDVSIFKSTLQQCKIKNWDSVCK